MKDRIPKYPGRVQLTPVAGAENTFDMTMADGPEQIGTPINKATLLTDETVKAYNGLSGTIKFSDLAPGTEFKVRGNDRAFMVAKHNYEPELNGNGYTLIVTPNPDVRVQFNRYLENLVFPTPEGAKYVGFGGDLDRFCETNAKEIGEYFPAKIQKVKIKYTPGGGDNEIQIIERTGFSLSATELNLSKELGSGRSIEYTNLVYNEEGSPLDSIEPLCVFINKYTTSQVLTRSPLISSSEGVYTDISISFHVNINGGYVGTFVYCFEAASPGAVVTSFCVPSSAEIEIDNSTDVPAIYFPSEEAVVNDALFKLSNSALFQKISTREAVRLSNLPIGTIVKINENGDPVDYIIVQKGIPEYGEHLYDSSCNGVWLLRRDVLPPIYWGNPDKYYADSAINIDLNNYIINGYDSNIRNLIKEVKIPHFFDGSVQIGSNAIPVKVFLLSDRELGFDDTTINDLYNPGDGAKLEYFLQGTGSEANTKRIAYLDGQAKPWWTRDKFGWHAVTPSDYICTVSNSGTITNILGTDKNTCVRPAFILPLDMEVYKDPDGTYYAVQSYYNAITSMSGHEIIKMPGVSKVLLGAVENYNAFEVVFDLTGIDLSMFNYLEIFGDTGTSGAVYLTFNDISSDYSYSYQYTQVGNNTGIGGLGRASNMMIASINRYPFRFHVIIYPDAGPSAAFDSFSNHVNTYSGSTNSSHGFGSFSGEKVNLEKLTINFPGGSGNSIKLYGVR